MSSMEVAIGCGSVCKEQAPADGPALSPTGQSTDIILIEIIRVADGRMVAHWSVADRPAMLKQIGAMRGGAVEGICLGSAVI